MCVLHAVFSLFCHSKTPFSCSHPPSFYSWGFIVHHISNTLFNDLIYFLFLHLLTKTPLSAFSALAFDLASTAGRTSVQWFLPTGQTHINGGSGSLETHGRSSTPKSPLCQSFCFFIYFISHSFEEQKRRTVSALLTSDFSFTLYCFAKMIISCFTKKLKGAALVLSHLSSLIYPWTCLHSLCQGTVLLASPHGCFIDVQDQSHKQTPLPLLIPVLVFPISDKTTASFQLPKSKTWGSSWLLLLP